MPSSIQQVQSPEDMGNSNATISKSHYWSPQCHQRISGRGMWFKSRPTLLSVSSRIPLSPSRGQWSSPWNRCHVVAWEDTRHATPQRRALEPAVLALLNDPVHLPFAQLQLVVLLRLVGIQGQVAVGRGYTGRKHTHDISHHLSCSNSSPTEQKETRSTVQKL